MHPGRLPVKGRAPSASSRPSPCSATSSAYLGLPSQRVEHGLRALSPGATTCPRQLSEVLGCCLMICRLHGSVRRAALESVSVRDVRSHRRSHVDDLPAGRCQVVLRPGLACWRDHLIALATPSCLGCGAGGLWCGEAASYRGAEREERGGDLLDDRLAAPGPRSAPGRGGGPRGRPRQRGGDR